VVGIKKKSFEIKKEKETSSFTRKMFVFYEYITHNHFQKKQHLK